jgi:hypothetical protein
MAKRGRAGGGGGGGGGGGLNAIAVADLQRELARRQRRAGSIMRKRERLVERLRAIDAEIAGLGLSVRGAAGGGVVLGRRRPRNDMNLVEALAKALDGKTMSVTEVAEEVQRQGYQTTSPSFRTIVNQTLINSGKFKRVSRGQYTLK